DPPRPARRGQVDPRRLGQGPLLLPPAARLPPRRRRGRLYPRPLARPDDHDGLRRRQGRLRGEAPDPVRPRGPLDDRRGPPPPPRRAGGDAAALRAPLPAGPTAHPGGAPRENLLG